MKSDKNLKQEEYYITSKKLFDVSVIASSKHLLKDYEGNFVVTPFSNSYACPLITAMIYNIPISKRKDRDAIFAYLYHTAKAANGNEGNDIEDNCSEDNSSEEVIENPVIQAVGFSKKNIYSIHEISSTLNNMNYQSAVFVTDPDYLCSGNILIPSNISLTEFLQIASKKMHLSIAFIISNNLSNNLFDGKIMIGKNKKNNSYDSKDIYLAQSLSESCINQATKRIVSIF